MTNIISLSDSASHSFFARNFKKMDNGSMRLVIINIVLCGTVGTFFLYPVFYRVFGLYLGFVFVAVVGLINYLTSVFIAEAAEDVKTDDYLVMIYKLLPSLYGFSKFTLLLDYMIGALLGPIIGFNVFLYILNHFEVLNESAVKKGEILEFNQFDSQVIIMRLVFVGVAFIALLPFYTRTVFGKLKFIFICLTISMLALIIYLFFDLLNFKEYYVNNGTYSLTHFNYPNSDWLKYSMIFMTVFYMQSGILTMKKDMLHPNLRRMKKTLSISFVLLTCIAMIFGFFGYYCLGDMHTSDLFMLRKSFPGKQNELIYNIVLIFYCIFITFYSSFFNLCMKDYIKTAYNVNWSNNFMSIGGLTFVMSVTFLYPNFVNLIGYNAIFVCLFNGFVFPCLLKRKLIKKRNQSTLYLLFIDSITITLVLLSIISFIILTYGEAF